MNFFQTPLLIKHKKFPRFIGGPLDGITDAPFRKLVRDFSTEELLYTEMRHVRSIITPKGGAMALDFSPREHPLNFQVAANSSDFVGAACEKILEHGIDMIDLNVGCPANNVISSCSGSALMANPCMLEKILKEFKNVLPAHVIFTIKIRAGFKEVNAIDIAKLAQDCGVDALAIHPRLRTQMFNGQPDYQLAAQVKKALQIPVIFSGNVVNFKTAKMTYEMTGVDGFLIGRGIWAKPWKLEEMKQHALGNEYSVDSATILQVALRHLTLMMQAYGVHGLFRFRKHLPFYIKGHPAASALRERLVRSESEFDIRQGLQEFLGRN
jgi:tRNA-dihydrouridine synthase B